MKKLFGIVLALASIALLRAQGDGGTGAGATGRQWEVEGDVIDDAGPVSDVKIQFSGPDRVKPVATDSQGHYNVRGTTPGTYSITASKEGTGGARVRSVRLGAGSHLESIDFHLAKEAVISGRVLDQDKEPIRGASVSVWAKTYRDGRLNFEPRQNAATDDLGEYRLTDLSEGVYYLVSVPKHPEVRKRTASLPVKGARKPMLGLTRTTFYPGSPSFEGVQPIHVHAAEHLEGMDFLAQETETHCLRVGIAWPQEGREGDATGLRLSIFAPIGDVALNVASELVHPGDQLEICGLPPGLYRAMAIAFSGQTGKVTGFTDSDFGVERKDVDIGSLSPLPTARVRGTVLVENARPEDAPPSNPVVRLAVRGRPGFGRESLRGSVDAGSFVIEGVLAGEYELRLLGLTKGYYIRGATQQGRDILKGGLRTGRGEIQIVLGKNGPTVGGQTLSDDGQPVRDALVFLVPKDGDGFFKQQSDQNGHFEFTSEIAPGEYRIVALTGVLDGEDEDFTVILGNLSHATEISLEPNAKLSVSLAIHSAH